MPFEIRSKNDDAPVLTSTDLWGKYAKPASPTHWKEGRSALELARAWTSTPGQMPHEVTSALADGPFADLQLAHGRAELKTPFPDGSAGPRNHDLVVVATCSRGNVLLDVEGKERETFDRTLVQRWTKREAAKPRSNIRPRILRWSSLLSGRYYDRLTADLEPLRYQLFSGLAGSIRLANIKHCTAAVFLVHQFEHAQPAPSLARMYDRNQRDLDAFTHWLNPALPLVGRGSGSLVVRILRAGESNSLFDGVELYVAKAVRKLP
jgi:hypothetical protein